MARSPFEQRPEGAHRRPTEKKIREVVEFFCNMESPLLRDHFRKEFHAYARGAQEPPAAWEEMFRGWTREDFQRAWEMYQGIEKLKAMDIDRRAAN